MLKRFTTEADIHLKEFNNTISYKQNTQLFLNYPKQIIDAPNQCLCLSRNIKKLAFGIIFIIALGSKYTSVIISPK